MMALVAARPHGIPVEASTVESQVAFIEADLGRGAERFREGRGQGNGATGAGYAVWSLERAGRPPSPETEAVIDYLLKQPGDGWRGTCRRPPAEGSPFTATAVALAALRRPTSPDRQPRIAERIALARDWLERTPATDTEDRVFRLRGLLFASASPDTLKQAGAELLQTQNLDGGWSQQPEAISDPYATGSVLAALAETRQLLANDPTYRRGIAFLLKSQLPDGTWRVPSRSRPFQSHFESGFPHERDQFLSVAATGWAIIALSHALP